jgi:hypothetical protein
MWLVNGWGVRRGVHTAMKDNALCKQVKLSEISTPNKKSLTFPKRTQVENLKS